LAQPDQLWTPDGVVRYGLLLQVFDADTVYHVLGTAWSLSIEIGFYLALPILAWLIARVLGGRPGLGRHLGILVALLAAATALRYLVIGPVQAAAGEDPGLAGFTVAGSFGPFAAGMALAAVTVSRPELLATLHRTPRGVRFVVARLLRKDGPWLALALLAYSLGLIVEGRYIVPWQPGVFATIAATALLVPLVVRPATSRAAALLGGSRALVGLGAISYGLYLWHWPIQELARTHGFAVEGSVLGWAVGFATMATLGILAATASYRFVEAPINSRVRSLTRTRRPSGAGEVGGLESGSVSGPPGSTPATDARDRRKTARPIARAES
jgi:peptidoglycan/LPS O-acetylase OafA/YrhL